MALNLIAATELKSVSLTRLQTALDVVVQATKSDAQGLVSLALVNEPTSRQLNRKFAGNDYATDVLSFDYFEAESRIPSEHDVRGEIVICLPLAERQAKECGVGLVSELTMLLVHGALHLLGYDHDGTSGASFRTLQDDIMSKLKLESRNIFDGNIH